MEIGEALSAEIGSLVGGRIYPTVIPQNADLPALAYQLINGKTITAHDGSSGLETAIYQISCAASTYGGAVSLAKSVKTALHGFSGVMGGTGGVEVEVALIKNVTDDFGYDLKTRVVRTDVFIMFKN